MSLTGALFNITTTLLVVYAFFLIFMFSIQEKLIFPAPPINYLLYESLHELSLNVHVNEHVIQGWKFPGENPASNLVAIYFGGNGEDVGRSIPNLKKIPASKIYTFNYRGYGLSTGVSNEKALYNDALHLVKLVKDAHPNSQVLIIGYSLGSAIAGYAASQTQPSYLLLLAPLYSVERIAKDKFGAFLPSAILKHKFNLFESAKDIKSKTLIVCAGTDLVINSTHSLDTFEAISSSSKKMVSIEGAGHNDLLLKAETFELIREMIRK